MVGVRGQYKLETPAGAKHQSHCTVERIHTRNMFAKLFVVCALAAVALAQQKYPAGLHPAVCPNYPYCDTTAFQRFTPQGQPIPEWVYNPSILPVAPADPNAAAGARYPANFNAATCPNYPYCW